jgi:hypothetical protein
MTEGTGEVGELQGEGARRAGTVDKFSREHGPARARRPDQRWLSLVSAPERYDRVYAMRSHDEERALCLLQSATARRLWTVTVKPLIDNQDACLANRVLPSVANPHVHEQRDAIHSAMSDPTSRVNLDRLRPGFALATGTATPMPPYAASVRERAIRETAESTAMASVCRADRQSIEATAQTSSATMHSDHSVCAMSSLLNRHRSADDSSSVVDDVCDRSCNTDDDDDDIDCC